MQKMLDQLRIGLEIEIVTVIVLGAPLFLFRFLKFEMFTNLTSLRTTFCFRGIKMFKPGYLTLWAELSVLVGLF